MKSYWKKYMVNNQYIGSFDEKLEDVIKQVKEELGLSRTKMIAEPGGF